MTETYKGLENPSKKPEITLEAGQTKATFLQLRDVMPELFSTQALKYQAKQLLKEQSDRLRNMASVYVDEPALKVAAETAQIVLARAFAVINYEVPSEGEIQDEPASEYGWASDVRRTRKVSHFLPSSERMTSALDNLRDFLGQMNVIMAFMDQVVDLSDQIESIKESQGTSINFEAKYFADLLEKRAELEEMRQANGNGKAATILLTKIEAVIRSLEQSVQREQTKRGELSARLVAREEEMSRMRRIAAEHHDLAGDIAIQVMCRRNGMSDEQVNMIASKTLGHSFYESVSEVLKGKIEREYLAYNKELEFKKKIEVQSNQLRTAREKARRILSGVRLTVSMALAGAVVAVYLSQTNDVAPRAPESHDQSPENGVQELEFVRRNVMAYLQHEGRLNPELKKRLARSENLRELEGGLLGYFQEMWFDSSYDPTYNHVSLKINPDVSKLVQVMYGREAELGVYDGRTNTKAVEMSLLKSLLCEEGYSVGLFISAHDEDGGAVHMLNETVKQKFLCR